MAMKLQELRTIARRQHIKSEGRSKTDLVRAIQLQEGNFDCFATADSRECDQPDCLWRNDCFACVGK
jgi:hypothetical protein